jgi:probable metal-binding protein
LRGRAVRGYLQTMEAHSAPRDPVFGHELISLLSRMGGAASVAALRGEALSAFGADAVYGNCHGDRFTFDEVLAFLASRGKLSLSGGDVSLGQIPACGAQ